MRKCLSVLFVSFAYLGLGAADSRATILTFGGAGQTSNLAVPSTFGDFAAADSAGLTVSNGATPDINLTWSTAVPSATSRWEFYNDAEWKAAQLNGETANSPFYLTLTPNLGIGVIVDSFVFDNYVAWQGGANFSWALLQDNTAGTVIVSGSNIGVTDGQNLPVSTGMASAYFGTVVLRLNVHNDPDTVGTSDAAIDDIAFRQVPEPGAIVLAGIAVSMTFGFRMVKRRNRNHTSK
jgi:hypothetical protein